MEEATDNASAHFLSGPSLQDYHLSVDCGTIFFTEDDYLWY
jgi:hypothetical protein